MLLLLFSEPNFDGTFNDTPPDPYYADPGIGFIDPFILYVIGALAVTIIIAVVIGSYIGRRHAAMRLAEAKRRSVDHIYDSIRYRLDRALESRGLAIIERATLVREEVHNRLGHVMALLDKPGKSLEELKKALPGSREPEKPKPAKVKVAMSAEEQMIAVWEGLNRFRVFWSNEAYVKDLIRAAQNELANTDSLAFVRGLEAKYLPPKPIVTWRPAWPEKKSKAEAIVTAALEDADRGEIAPAPVAELPPEPTPPVPPPTRPRKLPAHKRNMLA